MRKKYLSALLFGALVMASTATFTSCKDYDDDIENLQGQINSNASAIKALQDKVTAGKWITDLSSVAGGFKVTFSDGQSFTIVNGKDGVNGADGAAGEAGVAGADGTKVTIGEDGYWYLDGEKTEYKAVADESVQMKAPFLGEDGFLYFYEEGSEEPVKSDIFNSAGVYAVITGDVVSLYTFDEDGNLVEIVAPTAENTLTNVDLGANALIQRTNNGYAWGVAEEAIEWNGETIAAGTLLTAPLGTSSITVTPLNYDLETQELTLIDIDGNEAPIVVTATATPAEDAGTTDRAASIDGKWTLSYAYDETITAENIATAFTKTVKGVEKNLTYALAVNGVRMTGYDFVIDTQTAKEQEKNVAVKAENVKLNSEKAEIGETTLKVADAISGQVVDAYMEFAGNSAAQAAIGVKIEGMTIIAPASTAGKTYNVNVYILDVTGSVVKSKTTSAITIASTQQGTTTTETTAATSVQVAIEKTIKVDLGDIFKNLSNELVVAIDMTKTVITVDSKNFFALTDVASMKVNEGNVVTLKQSDDETGVGNDLRSASFAYITLPQMKTGASQLKDLFNSFKLTMTLRDGLKNELKKIEIPVTVKAPTFDYYFAANEYASWDGSALNKAVVAIDTPEALVEEDVEETSAPTPGFVLGNKFVLTKEGKKALETSEISYTMSYSIKNEDGTYATKVVDAPIDKTFTLDGEFVNIPTYNNKGEALYEDDGETPKRANVEKNILEVVNEDAGLKKLNVSAVTVKAIQQVSEITLAGEEEATPINVEKSFTVNIKPAFASAPKVAWVVNDKATESAAQVDSADEIAFWAPSSPSEDDVTTYTDGLAIIGTDGKPVKIEASAAYGSFQITPVVSLSASENATAINMGFATDEETSSVGTVGYSEGALTVRGLNIGEGGQIVVTYVDQFGLTTTTTFKYKK